MLLASDDTGGATKGLANGRLTGLVELASSVAGAAAVDAGCARTGDASSVLIGFKKEVRLVAVGE